MKRKIFGFTSIEAVSVVIIVCVLIATIAPRFLQDIPNEEVSIIHHDQHDINSIASTLASASAFNHASNLAFDAGLIASTPVNVHACEDIQSVLKDDVIKNYKIIKGLGAAIDSGGINREGGSSNCIVTLASDSRINATFVGYGVAL